MMRFFKTAIIIALILNSNLLNAQVQIYISPTGSDKNIGSEDQPFATLQQARDHIRELKKKGLNKDVNVYLRKGTYYLSETLELGLQDSAPEGHRITFKNYEDEHPVLSSGIKITGWTKETNDLPGLPAEAKGKIWSASLPPGINSFYTLYEGDTRLPRAVTKGFFPTKEYVSNNPEKPEDLYLLEFPAGKIKNWDNLPDVEVFIQPAVAWTMNILSLEWVDEKKNVAKTKIPATYPLTGTKHERFPEGTVRVENVFEGLDGPNKWVLNSKSRKIYIWPANEKPGENIMAPKLKVLIKVAGNSRIKEAADIPVKGIHFQGLTFTQADRGDTWDLDDSGIQHDWEMEDKDNAMLRFRGAEDCSVDACHFYNAGDNAIRLDFHAQRIEIKNSLFHDLGQSAVMMLGYGPGTKDVNKYNKVVNNHIHDCGQIWWHSQMITMWQSGENLVAHNYIHNVPRKAVAISGVRPPAFRPNAPDVRETRRSIRFNEVGKASKLEELPPFLHARNNIVEYNEIHHALNKMGDGGVINASGAGLGNIIRYNYIHDINNPQANSCIRCDNAQNGTTISHNIIFNSPNIGIAPKGKNIVRNNFLIDVSKGTGKGMIQGLGNFGNSDIVNNIFVTTNTNDVFYTFIKDAKPPELYKMMTDNTVDKNIYYRANDPDFKPTPVLAALQKNGFDKHSLYTDPLFVNWQKGDFRLRKESPAFTLGIEQIDISDKVGLTKDYPVYLKNIDTKSSISRIGKSEIK